MLSEGWTAEPTGCDRLFLQSSHLLRRTFQIPLLFQALNSSWAHQGQPVEWRHDLNSVHMPGLLLLFITLPATLCCQLSLWTHCVYESSVTKHAASWYLSVSPDKDTASINKVGHSLYCKSFSFIRVRSFVIKKEDWCSSIWNPIHQSKASSMLHKKCCSNCHLHSTFFK